MPQNFKFVFNHTKIIFILRGPPGSGKSTVANGLKTWLPQSLIISADNYRFKYDPQKKKKVYVFNEKENSKCHNLCNNATVMAMQASHSPIIIDNTNIKNHEYKFYLDLARQFDYFIYIIEPATEWMNDVETLAKKNVHNVPKETIARMLNNYERNIPRYFGWFLPTGKNHLTLQIPVDPPPELLNRWDLVAYIQALLDELKSHALLKLFLKDSFKTNKIEYPYSNVTDNRFGNLKNISVLNPFHITSFFTRHKQYKEYFERPAVYEALTCGRIDIFDIVGIYFTEKVIGLRVLLGEENVQDLAQFWMNDDMESTWHSNEETLKKRKPGCRAHMTLGVSRTGKVSDCGVEQLRLLDIENTNPSPPLQTTQTPSGSLTYYKEDKIIYLKLDNPKKFIGQFGAYYF